MFESVLCIRIQLVAPVRTARAAIRRRIAIAVGCLEKNKSDKMRSLVQLAAWNTLDAPVSTMLPEAAGTGASASRKSTKFRVLATPKYSVKARIRRPGHLHAADNSVNSKISPPNTSQRDKLISFSNLHRPRLQFIFIGSSPNQSRNSATVTFRSHTVQI